MNDIDIFMQPLASLSKEEGVADEKPEFIDWVKKSTEKAREIINGSISRI